MQRIQSIEIKLTDNPRGKTWRKLISKTNSMGTNYWPNGRMRASDIAATIQKAPKRNPAKVWLNQTNGNFKKPWLLLAVLKKNKVLPPFQIWYLLYIICFHVHLFSCFENFIQCTLLSRRLLSMMKHQWTLS